MQIICLAVTAPRQRSCTLASCKLVSREWCDYARLASKEISVSSSETRGSHVAHLLAALQSNPQVDSLCLYIDHHAPFANWGGVVSALASRKWSSIALACETDCESFCLATLLSASCSTLQNLELVNAELAVSGLDQVFRQSKNLQTIYLTGHGRISPQQFAAVLANASTCPQVKDLVFDDLWGAGEERHVSLPDDQCLNLIPSTFPNVRALSFTAAASISTEAYVALPSKLPCLTSLRITGTQLLHLNDAVLFSISRSCPLLQELVLGSPMVTLQHTSRDALINITAVGLVAILQRCPSLASLKLPCLPKVPEEAWPPLLRGIRNIKTLECPWICKVTPAFSALKKLERLALYDWGVQVIKQVDLEQVARVVGQLPNLLRLKICSAELKAAVVDIMKSHMPGIKLESYLRENEGWRMKKH